MKINELRKPSGQSLSNRFVQTNARRDRHVERIEVADLRDFGDRVGFFQKRGVHAVAFFAEQNGGRNRKIDLKNGHRTVGQSGRDDLNAAQFQKINGRREAVFAANGQVVERTGGRFHRVFVQKRGVRFGQNEALRTSQKGRSGNRADVSHIRHAVQKHEKRRFAALERQRHEVFEPRIFQNGQRRDDALMLAGDEAAEFFARHDLHRHVVFAAKSAHVFFEIASDAGLKKDFIERFLREKRLHDGVHAEDECHFFDFGFRVSDIGFFRVALKIGGEGRFFGCQKIHLRRKKKPMHRVVFACFLAQLIVFFDSKIAAQAGCTDPQASNFSPSATSNDGSCAYPATDFLPTKRADLPAEMAEISGMIWASGRLFALNDGGNGDFLYQIDTTTGAVVQKIKLEGEDNIDWEDLATDGSRLFVADLGNNAGDRTDLNVLAFPVSAIPIGASVEVDKSAITHFKISYPDQTNFDPQTPNTTPFDGEAILFLNNRLHIFTKNWSLGQTAHYSMNLVNTTQILTKHEEFPSYSGLITAADIAPDKKTIALLGYAQAAEPPFVWLLSDWPSDEKLFSGNRRKISLASFFVGQAESVAFTGGRRGFLSNESTTLFGVTISQTLQTFDFSQFFSTVSTTDFFEYETATSLKIWPLPFSQLVDYECFSCEKIVVRDVFGRLVLEQKGSVGQLDTGFLNDGFYLFEAHENGRVFLKKAVKTGGGF